MHDNANKQNKMSLKDNNKVVIALGGNALMQKYDSGTAEEQLKQSRKSYTSGIKDLIESGTLSPRAYRRLEELIAEIEPSLELQDDYKELYELAEEITADKEKELEELEELSIEQEETIQNLEQNMVQILI